MVAHNLDGCNSHFLLGMRRNRARS